MSSTAFEGNQELFLDILTKEEQEALLTKKMEEIRKKNEALQKRHEEIQKDKKVAEVMGGNKGKKVTSPQKETHSLPGGEAYKFTAELSSQPTHNEPKERKPAARVKPRKNTKQQKLRSVHHAVDSGDSQINKFAMIEEWNKGVQSQNGAQIYGFDFLQRPKSADYGEESTKRQSWGKENKQERFVREDSKQSDRPRRPHSFRENDRQQRQNGAPSREFNQDGNYYKRRSREYDTGRPTSYHEDGYKQSSGYDKKRNSGYQEGGYSRQSSGSQDGGSSRQSTGSKDGGYVRQGSRGQDGGYSRQSSGSQDGGYSRQSSGSQDGGYARQSSGGQEFRHQKNQRFQSHDSEFEPQRKRRQGANTHKDWEQSENNPCGPPPDPAYNFLSDRVRENTSQSNDRKEVRRHPKNFGGADFGNVKSKMKVVKEKQERERSGPPRSKMEMTIAMTGRERRQYMEWKAEREKVDQARIQRQKCSSGEWKREWDVEKDYNEEQERRSEPAKRPAGRIGSGRFDRGEREERSKGGEHSNKHQRDQDHQSQKDGEHTRSRKEEGNHVRFQKEEEHVRPRKENTEQTRQRREEGEARSAGRGRGRGRGSRRSGEDRKPQRARTISGGEDRKVENQHDLLVIKVDNSPGKAADGSVALEYSDGESTTTGITDARTSTSCAQTSTDELWWDEEADEVSLSLVGDSLDGITPEDDIFNPKDLFDGSLEEDHDGLELHDSGHDEGFDYYDEEGQFENAPRQSQGDTDEWEDCDDDEDDAESRTSSDVLKVNCNLNPEAPEFTPSSPISPLSPVAMMTPTKDSKNRKEKPRASGSNRKENTSPKKPSPKSTPKTEDTKTGVEKVTKQLFTADNTAPNANTTSSADKTSENVTKHSDDADAPQKSTARTVTEAATSSTLDEQSSGTESALPGTEESNKEEVGCSEEPKVTGQSENSTECKQVTSNTGQDKPVVEPSLSEYYTIDSKAKDNSTEGAETKPKAQESSIEGADNEPKAQESSTEGADNEPISQESSIESSIEGADSKPKAQESSTEGADNETVESSTKETGIDSKALENSKEMADSTETSIESDKSALSEEDKVEDVAKDSAVPS